MKHFSLDAVAMLLLVVGGLNAGIDAVFSYDTLGQIMNSNVSTVFYALVGLAAVYAIAERAGFIGSEA